MICEAGTSTTILSDLENLYSFTASSGANLTTNSHNIRCYGNITLSGATSISNGGSSIFYSEYEDANPLIVYVDSSASNISGCDFHVKMYDGVTTQARGISILSTIKDLYVTGYQRVIYHAHLLRVTSAQNWYFNMSDLTYLTTSGAASTVSGNIQFNGASSIGRLNIAGWPWYNSAPQQTTLTCNGTVTGQYLNLAGINAAGTADWGALTSIVGGLGDGGGNSANIVGTTSKTVYYTGNTGSLSDTSKIVRKLLNFNGTSSYVNLSNALSYLMTTTNSWTLDFSLICNNNARILSNICTSPSPSPGFDIFSDSGRIYLILNQVWTTDTLFVYTPVIGFSTRKRVTIKYAGNKLLSGISVLIDNVSVSVSKNFNNLSSTTLTQSSSHTKIGASQANSSGGVASLLNGSISDMKIWSSVVDPTTTTLLPDLLNMSLDEGGAYANGTILYDRSSSSNNATMQGFSTNPWTNSGTGYSVLPQDTVICDANSFTTTGQTLTIDRFFPFRNFICNNVVNSPTIHIATYYQPSGNVDFSGFASMTNTNSYPLRLFSFQDVTLKAATGMDFKALNAYVTSGKSLTMLSDITASTGSNITWGIFKPNGYKLLTSNIIVGFATMAFSSKSGVDFTSGVLALTGVGEVFLQNLRYLSIQLQNTYGSCVVRLTDTTAVEKIIRFHSYASNAYDIPFGGVELVSGTLRFTCTYNTSTIVSKLFLYLKKLILAAGTTVNFFDSTLFTNHKTIIGSIETSGTAANPVTISPYNSGATMNVDISSDKLNVSGVLDAGQADVTGINCSQLNTFYTRKTMTNCTRVYNQVPYLINEIKPFGRLRSEIANKINGVYDFNNIKTIETYN